MPAFNAVGLRKVELLDIKNGMEFAIANDTGLTTQQQDRYQFVADIIADMRQQVADFDTANGTDTDPAAVITVTVRAF